MANPTPNDATGGTWTEIHEQLAYAYVRGWYDGCDGITNDSRKIEVANELAAKIPAVNNHAKLVEALRDIKEGNYPKGKMALILAMAERGDLAGAREEMICALQKMADDALLQSIEKGGAR